MRPSDKEGCDSASNPRRHPALGTENNPVVFSPHIQIVYSFCGPAEASFHFPYRNREDEFIRLNDAQKLVLWKPMQQEIHNVCHGRECAPKVKSPKSCLKHCPTAER